MGDGRNHFEILADFKLKPGSPQAIAKGCKCMPGTRGDHDCSIHGLEALVVQLRQEPMPASRTAPDPAMADAVVTDPIETDTIVTDPVVTDPVIESPPPEMPVTKQPRSLTWPLTRLWPGPLSWPTSWRSSWSWRRPPRWRRARNRSRTIFGSTWTAEDLARSRLTLILFVIGGVTFAAPALLAVALIATGNTYLFD